MDILGIKFAPLCVPLRRRLQTLAVTLKVLLIDGGSLVGCLFTTYLLLYTDLWWIIFIYLGWIYLDRDIGEKGGRPIDWIRNWTWWIFNRDYYPCSISHVPGVTLDAKRNYLFCCFPHGILSHGVFGTIGTNRVRFNELFPYHVPYVAVLPLLFPIPFYRDFILSLGAITCSANSLNYILSRPEGGHIAALMPGGAAEAYYSRPGQYKILLKKRKGFVRLALKNGAPLVPVMSFGEPDLYEQLEIPILFRIQEFFRRITGIAPTLAKGRGMFQYSFGILPQRREINVLVGKPIEVVKRENPSNEEIEKLHEIFSKELTTMFQKYKHKYLKNHQDLNLDLISEEMICS